jgi:hypothetical protein
MSVLDPIAGMLVLAHALASSGVSARVLYDTDETALNVDPTGNRHFKAADESRAARPAR